MTAANLADRFSRALEPLFTKNVSESPFASWGENHETSEDRRFRLTGIFAAALRLKAATISTSSRYEFILYPLGTPHVKNTSANVPRDVSHCREFNDPAQSKSWQYASLHAYTAVASLPRDNFADALVSPKNFISKTVEERARFSKYNKFVTATKSEEARATPGTANRQHPREHANLINSASTNSVPTNSLTTGSMAVANPKLTSKNATNRVSDQPRVRQVQSKAVNPRAPEPSTIPSSQKPTATKKPEENSRTNPQTVKRSSKVDKATGEKVPKCDICKAEFASNHSLIRHQKNGRVLDAL